MFYLDLFIQEKREQGPVSEIEAYARGRMDEQHGTYCNQRTAYSIVSFLSLFLSVNLHHVICTCFHSLQAAYSKAIKEKHGEDYDWQNAIIDGEVVYKAGHGKRHGRYLIGNGMISTTALLSEMQSSTDDTLNGSAPSKRLRLDTGSTSIEQLQSEMQEMRESWEQELQLEREAREHELQLERNAWEQQLQEERTARQKEHEARMQEQKEHKDERAYFDNVISVSI
jgi:hypothetical protein